MTPHALEPSAVPLVYGAVILIFARDNRCNIVPAKLIHLVRYHRNGSSPVRAKQSERRSFRPRRSPADELATPRETRSHVHQVRGALRHSLPTATRAEAAALAG